MNSEQKQGNCKKLRNNSWTMNTSNMPNKSV